MCLIRPYCGESASLRRIQGDAHNLAYTLLAQRPYATSVWGLKLLVYGLKLRARIQGDMHEEVTMQERYKGLAR